jgi:ANTAR domain
VVPGPRPSDDPCGAASSGAGPGPAADHSPRVALARTVRGWAVVPVPAPTAGEPVADPIEGMTLADLIADELGALPEPDRDARRSARGPAEPLTDVDPVDLRVAALERTVAQLEHALAARVSTERAIGVLAERNGTSLRTAFEGMRRQARTEGRPVVELAREVLDGLAAKPCELARPQPAAMPAALPRPLGPPQEAVAATDGRS